MAKRTVQQQIDDLAARKHRDELRVLAREANNATRTALGERDYDTAIACIDETRKYVAELQKLADGGAVDVKPSSDASNAAAPELPL